VSTPATIAGWNLTLARDYAEPFPGRGYVEVQPNGEFEVAYETDQSARDMGLPGFLLTRVPAEVIRALLEAYDAKQAPTPAPARPRLELLDDLTTSAEHIAAAMVRVAPADREAFAEIAHALESMTIVARELAK
jgi:hypothetical protein